MPSEWYDEKSKDKPIDISMNPQQAQHILEDENYSGQDTTSKGTRTYEGTALGYSCEDGESSRRSGPA